MRTSKTNTQANTPCKESEKTIEVSKVQKLLDFNIQKAKNLAFNIIRYQESGRDINILAITTELACTRLVILQLISLLNNN